MFDIAFAGSAVRATQSEFKAFMGIPSASDGVPQSLLEFGRQPADEAWVFRCVHLKAMAVQSAPLRVEVRDGTEWVPLGAKSDSAGEDLQFLLDDVNPAWEGAQLQAYTSAGGCVHGGSYWLMVKGKYGGQPQELHWLSGALVEPEMGRTFPEGYWHTPMGTGQRDYYPAERIIPFRDIVNLQDPYRLLSPLSAARFEISTNKRASEWNDSLLRNWGIPAGAWVAKENVELTPTDRSYIKRAFAALRGPKNQGKTPILPAGLSWQQLSMSQKDADWIASRKVSRMTICAVLGVPLVLAGDDEKASVYASTRDAERVFWRQTMINELTHRAVPINSYLVPLFDPTRKKLRVAYDFTGVEALRGAPTEEMAQWLAYVKAGLPINRAIKQFGMGDPLEGGDEAFKAQKDAQALADKQMEMKAEQGRPEEYDTPKKSGAEPTPGGDRVRALGRGLYKHPTVQAYIENGDTTHMHRLVAPEEMDTFLLGLRRRYSPRQILDGEPSQRYPGIRAVTAAGPLHLSVPVTVDDFAVKSIRDGLRDDLQARLDEVESMAASASRAAEAAVAVVGQVALIAEKVTRPRNVRKIPHRDASGRIVSVDEVEIA
jgi:HK97 family phage portal protein